MAAPTMPAASPVHDPGLQRLASCCAAGTDSFCLPCYIAGGNQQYAAFLFVREPTSDSMPPAEPVDKLVHRDAANAKRREFAADFQQGEGKGMKVQVGPLVATPCRAIGTAT